MLWNLPSVSIKEHPIAKNQNTYAKRKREMEKKAKAEAKRIRRNKRKQGLEERPPYEPPTHGQELSDDDHPANDGE